mgnify:CR=1 FL=1
MPAPGVWGPSIWNFFHTMAEKIHEDRFPVLGPELVKYIQRICRNLPCPDCSNHATRFFANAPPGAFSTKKALQESLFVFHNIVNRRKQKTIQNMDVLHQYKNRNIVGAYNKFVAVYHSRGNMKLLTDSFQRQMLMKDFKKWLISNIKYFQKQQPAGV